MSIGIFDSGVGGLTVYSEVEKNFPYVDIIYLGDTARVPYGNKSKDTVIRYSLECSSFLTENFDIDLIIVACNTASSYALDTLKSYFDIPVIGVVEPGVKNALKVSKNKKIGVIGTYATIRSNAYKNSLKNADRSVQIFQKPCPLFVPIVEEGMFDHKVAYILIKEYLQEIVEKGIDTLILGCTHYPLLKKAISKVYPEINIIDSSTAIIEQIKNIPFKREKGDRKVFFTDISPAFEKFKSYLLKDTPVQKLELSRLCKL